ncbi:MAG TPA: lysophospholipid acyltransferase family protein [Polyangia bacterium]
MPPLPLESALHVPAVDRAIDQIMGGDGFDQWGFSPEHAKRYYAAAYWVSRYFRPVITGLENIPRGRVLIVPNHSGQLPFDGLVVAVACLTEAQPPRLLRPMAERWFPTLPFVNVAFQRTGVVVGDPINCRNLLQAEQAILVFPEGARGSGKPWSHRYRLVDFGRGFMRLALQTDTPIVPVSVVGAEESIISLADLKPLARLLRMPYFPLPALLPVLGPLAYLPLPTRFHVTFGEPMRFTGPFDDEDEAIDVKVRQVMERVQAMIAEGRARRQSVFA